MKASPLPDCPLLLLQKDFLSAEEAESCFQQLLNHHDWPASDYEVFGRRFSLPRQQTWHADEGIVYSYHNNLLTTRPWTPSLQRLREKVESSTGSQFNAVLVNLYRNGDDFVGWHSDDEKEMGDEPVIASLSLGAERVFSYRRQSPRGPLAGSESGVSLPSGSLVLMQAPFQDEWEHAVLRNTSTTARINLTFRYVLPPPSEG